jgi:putative membrane protein
MSEVTQPGNFMPMDYGWGWGMMTMNGIGWLLLLAVVVVVGAIVLFRGLGGGVRPGGPRLPDERSARELLDSRYAAGEIGREEYLRMKEDIG